MNPFSQTLSTRFRTHLRVISPVGLEQLVRRVGVRLGQGSVRDSAAGSGRKCIFLPFRHDTCSAVVAHFSSHGRPF